jgi:hypothetical protein
MVNAIDVSPHDPAVAYVTVMKYKEGDNEPYVFRTTNYGQSWREISDGLPREHFARVVREDPDREGLLFAGMERGLYVSFDNGDEWQALQLNLPVVPVTDLMVRRGDLVLATQGRGFWVIDDISPLRQFAAEQQSAAHLYDPRAAYRLTPTRGGNSGGESWAPSAPNGAIIYYSLPEAPDLDDASVKLEILDSSGNVIRTLETDADTGAEGGGSGVDYALPAERGTNRIVWDLRQKPTPEIDYPFLFGAARGAKSFSGHTVGPGTYGLRMTAGDNVLESNVEVRWDPINDYDDAATRDQQAMLSDLYGMLESLYQRLNALLAIKEQVELRKSLAEKAGDTAQAESATSMLEALSDWQLSVSTPQRTNNQDVLNFPARLDAFLVNLYGQVDAAVLGVTQGQRDRFDDLEPQWREAVAAWDQLIEGDVADYIRQAGPAVVVPEWE